MANLAVIEINDKKVRLSIYATANGRFKLIEEKNQPVALGEEILQEELLRPKTKNEVLEVLKIYRKLIEIYKAPQIIAVASDIIQKARNYRGFIDEIYNNTGINFSIMSSEEFVKNIYTATINSIDNSKGYLIHIGSYKSYLVKYNRRTILSTSVIEIGAANIATDELGNTRNIEQMLQAAKDELKMHQFNLDTEQDNVFVGVGTAFVNYGRIAKKIARYPLELDNNYQISDSLSNQIFDFIKGIDLEKIGKIKGVNDADASEVVGTVAIVKAFYEQINIGELTISSAEVREGMVHSNVTQPSQEKFNDLLANSLDNYYEFFKDEYSINNQVYAMALILFKQLKVMHKLPRFYVKPLRIASFLYDAGKNINYSNYEKNGFDAILNSGITGVTHRELLLASFIVLNQNIDNFSLGEWMRYKDILAEEDLDAVRKLGVIVKLASALNASKKLIISDVVCDILGDSIIMKTIVNGDPTFEIMEGMKVAQDYKKVFKKSLQII